MTKDDSSSNGGWREQAELLKQTFLNRTDLFDCSDPALRAGRFELNSSLDMKPKQENRQLTINSLLKIRAKINLRLNIASTMRERLEKKQY